MEQPFGIILAGGRAQRMGGGDKPLQMLGGESLLARAAARLGPQVAALALSANGDAARFSSYGMPVLPDPLPGAPGPLAGVLAALDWAAEGGATAVVSVAGDTPFLPEDLVPQLLFAAETAGTGLALAATRGADGALCLHPTAGLWPVALRDELRAALDAGTRKVRLWAAQHGAATALFPEGRCDPFFNINTPEDLARAEGLLGA